MSVKTIYKFKARFEPMACLVTEYETDEASSEAEARIQACQCGMIPEGLLEEEEMEILMDIYTTQHMACLLIEHFKAFNS